MRSEKQKKCQWFNNWFRINCWTSILFGIWMNFYKYWRWSKYYAKKKTIFIVPLFLLIWRIVLNDNRYLIWQNMTFNSSIIIIEGAIMGQGMWSFMYEYTQLSPSKKSGRHCFHSILFLFETVTRYAFFFLLSLSAEFLKI